jgi:hypothetical protein
MPGPIQALLSCIKPLFAAGFLMVGALACTRESSPAGPLGASVDLRGRLKPEIVSQMPADGDSAMVEREYLTNIQGAEAKILWKTFNTGSGAYIASYRWEVVKSQSGVKLEPLGTLDTVNVGTESNVVQSETVRIRWHEQPLLGTKLGELSFRIDAKGAAHP